MEKRFGTPPDSWTPPKGHPCWWTTLWCTLPIFKISYFHKFYQSVWENLFISEYTQKSPKNLQNSPKRRYVGWALRFWTASRPEIYAIGIQFSTSYAFNSIIRCWTMMFSRLTQQDPNSFLLLTTQAGNELRAIFPVLDFPCTPRENCVPNVLLNSSMDQDCWFFFRVFMYFECFS